MHTLSKEKIINYFKPYHPQKIGIFGSYAREENSPQSDLDILINLNTEISLLDLVRMERELSELLGVKVDLVTDRSIRNQRLRQSIEKDLLLIFHEEG